MSEMIEAEEKTPASVDVPSGVPLDEILLAGAFFLGLTFAAAGIFPPGRAVVSGLILAAGAAAYRRHGGWRLPWPIVAPLAASAVSLLFAPIPLLGAEAWGQSFFFTLAAALLASSLSSIAVSWGIVAAALTLSGSILIDALRGLMLIGPAGVAFGSGGLLLGANVAGVALAVALTPLWRLHSARKIGSPTAIILVAILGAGLAFSGSRSGLLAAAGGLVVPLIALPRRARWRVLFFLLIVAAVGAFAYLPKFLARLDPSYITNAQRLSMLRGVAEAFPEAPFLGHGPGSFPVLGQRYLTWPKWELHPHSLPLRILFESGLLGVAGWGWTLWAALRSRITERNAVAFGIFTAITTGSLTDDVLWTPLFLFLFLTAGAGAIAAPGRRIGRAPILALALAWLAVGLLPYVDHLAPLSAYPSVQRKIDMAVRSGGEPAYAGCEMDPSALRVTAYAFAARGDTETAIVLLEEAARIDPNMIFGPNLLDLAWLNSSAGRETAALEHVERSRSIAPVLTSRFCGETAPCEQSWVDRHYGIEFPDPSIIPNSMIEDVFDIQDWRHHRYLTAQSLIAGETETAREHWRVAQSLASWQYGADPVLARLGVSLLDGAESEACAATARRRGGAAFPWGIFSPLIYRKPALSSGDNSPWWSARMEGPMAGGAS